MLNFILFWIFIIETSKTNKLTQIEYFACIVVAPNQQKYFNGKNIPTYGTRSIHVTK